MARSIDPASIRAYLARDWQRARDSKRGYWRGRLTRGGMSEALRITGQLRLSSNVNSDRGKDLETHSRVAQALAKTTPRREGAGTRARRVR